MSKQTFNPTMRLPVAILGVPFDNVTTAEALVRIQGMIASGRPHYLVTPNVDFLVQARRDTELRRILCDAHLVLCDGTPLLWVSRLLGNALAERVAGSDLVPLLIQMAAEKGYRVFFLGATPPAAEQAVARLRARFPELTIAGHYSPPFNTLLAMDHEEIRRRIFEAQPDLLLVGLGCPKQEKWMAMHYRELGVPVSVGVGGTIDFLAGQLKRAPMWMRRSGTEWLFRLAQEPQRLFRRYCTDLWVFGWAILPQWFWLRSRPRFRSQNHDRSRSLPIAADALEFCGVRHKIPQQRLSAGDAEILLQRLPHRLDIAALRTDHFTNTAPWGRDILLDMSGLKAIDSTGIAFLIRLEKTVRIEGGQLVLVGQRRPVKRALHILRVEEFFLCANNVDAARALLERRRQSQPVLAAESFGALRITWSGEITAANAQAIWERTHSHLVASATGNDLCIDMGQVPFIDSSGLGLMIRARKYATRQGKTLQFVNLRPAVQNVVRLARLEEFLLNVEPKAAQAQALTA